jgi:hypothetical protein
MNFIEVHSLISGIRVSYSRHDFAIMVLFHIADKKYNLPTNLFGLLCYIFGENNS